MAINGYLAMTAAEIEHSTPLPPNVAWMACHFSPYTRGLSNRPKELPPGAMLILNDITPIHGHEANLVASQLLELVESLGSIGVLLDFQRAGYPDAADLAKVLVGALPCPVAVSEVYAENLDCPVFLPPVPLHQPLKEYLAPWQDREVWLEWSTEGEILTLTEHGCTVTPLPYPDFTTPGFAEETLHCHYTMETNEKSARFTLWRTKEDWNALMEDAEKLGVLAVVGLYQELFSGL